MNGFKWQQKPKKGDIMYKEKYKIIKTLLWSVILTVFLVPSGTVSALDSRALPTGGEITSGKGKISTIGNQMTVKQNTPKMIAEWDTFNIGKRAGVTFRQPSSDAVALNRINDQNPSLILGSLRANGNIFLINPSGIVFGEGSRINVGGLVASSLNMSDQDFLTGRYIFTNDGNAGNILNQGKIRVKSGSFAALIAPGVTNEGTIKAKKGSVLLGAGNQVTLDFNGDGLISYTIDKGAVDALAANSGLIEADGGLVVMTAKAANSLTQAVVNNIGIIEAQTLKKKEGRIILMSDMENGQTLVGGTLDASAPKGGNGGFIETSAAQVIVADDARVTTYAPKGSFGLWLIDPQDYNVAASGGDMTGAFLSSTLASTSVSLQSSVGGTAGSGNVNINDTVLWSANSTLTLTASNDVNINSDITATGNSAGLVISSNTDNGGETATGTGVFNLNNGAVITLSGTTPSLTIAGNAYMVINELNGGITAVQNISSAPAGYYALGSDIDATATSSWNDGLGFIPIGKNNGSAFTGQFDGLGHTITNLTINSPTGKTSKNVGLFGYITGATVINVGLVNASVLGRANVGGLVGYNKGGSIHNSYVMGTVSGTDVDNAINVGGLVGYNTGSINNSYFAGSVTGSITDTSEISLNNNVGGLAGYNSGIVGNSYATGSVAGNLTGTVTVTYNNNVGGLVGDNVGTISNAYAAGGVTGSSTGNVVNNFGGLAGINTGTVNSGYWDMETSGQATSAGGTGLTTAQMMTMSSFSGWNIANTGGTSAIWRIYEGYTYPLLKNFLAPITVTPAFNGGGVYTDIAAYATDKSSFDASKINTSNMSLVLSSSAIPGEAIASLQGGIWSSQHGYDISNVARTLTGTGSNADDLRIGNYIAWKSNKLILKADKNIVIDSMLDGSDTAQLAMLYGQGAVASGNTSTYNVNAQVNLPEGYNFDTKLGSDGTTINYYVITRLGSAGSTSATDLQGMNGNLAGNFALGSNIDASATSSWNSGAGFVPIGNASIPFTGKFEGLGHTINNLTINRPTENYVGLFGYIGTGGIASNVGLVGGIVSGSAAIGIFAGVNSGTIENSYATGSVTGINYVGGLAGNNFGRVENSYFTGSASGNMIVSGLVGFNSGAIKNSYATSNLTGLLYVGELVGYNYGTVENSYATGSVSGNTCSGGLVGLNLGTIRNSYATNSFTGINYVGGLVGANYGTVENSYTTGSASGNMIVGGLVGFNNNNGTITNSYTMGSVTGALYVGGLVGYNYGTVENSYATGSASGNMAVGGLVGLNLSNIRNSYSTCSVTGSAYVGGLVGFNSGGSATNSFWDTETSGQATSALGTGKTTAEMKASATFTDAGWSTAVWDIEDDSYPTLKVF